MYIQDAEKNGTFQTRNNWNRGGRGTSVVVTSWQKSLKYHLFFRLQLLIVPTHFRKREWQQIENCRSSRKGLIDGFVQFQLITSCENILSMKRVFI